MISARQPLQRIAGFQEHTGPEQAPGSHHLRHRRGQGQRAGAGDDQGRAGNEDRLAHAHAGQEPADKGEQRDGVHGGHIDGDGPLGDLAIGRAALFTGFQHAPDIGHQAVSGHGDGPALDRLAEHHRTGIDARAGAGEDRRAFATHQAFVKFAGALDDIHVDDGALAGRKQDHVAGNHFAGTHGFGLPRDIDAGDGPGLEGGKIACGGMGAPAQAGIEETPDQQEEEQHHTGIEIGMLAAQRRLPDTDSQCEQDGQRDRNVHVCAAPGQHAPGRGEKGAPGEQHHRNGDGAGDHVHDGPRGLAHLPCPGPDRNRQQHDVRGGKAGHAHGGEQAALLTPGFVLIALGVERSDAIAEIGNRGGDVCGGQIALPCDAHLPIREVEPRFGDTRQDLHGLLDLGQARAAFRAAHAQLKAREPLAAHDEGRGIAEPGFRRGFRRPEALRTAGIGKVCQDIAHGRESRLWASNSTSSLPPCVAVTMTS